MLSRFRLPARILGLSCYLVIAVVAYFCFVANHDQPPFLFWDENYHVTSAERYIEGIAQFETHPPLGKLLIALGEYYSGSNKGIDKTMLARTKQISGDDLPRNFSFQGMRLMPSWFAAFAALLFYALLYELLENRLYALLFTSLYVFENAFVVHFRATHLDSFQIFFSLGFLWYFVRLWKLTVAVKWWQYALLSVWVSLAIMVKVNAVILLVLLPALYFHNAQYLSKKKISDYLPDFAGKAAVAIGSAVVVVFLVFTVHIAAGRNMPDPASPAGQKDIGFMSPQYRDFLEHHKPLTPYIVYRVFCDYYRFMEIDNKGVPKLDTSKPGENGSYPLHWPFHDRNINYRWDSADGKTSYVQLVGNQPAWYSGTAAVILSLLLVINYRVFGIQPRGTMRTYQIIEVFAVLWSVFMALHMWLISQRVMYLYHYFIGLIISYILLVLMWKYTSEVHPKFDRHKGKVLVGAVSVFVLSYWFFLPLTNHYPMTKDQCELRNIWISHIVDCQ